MKARFTVELYLDAESKVSEWLVVDTLTDSIIKKYPVQSKAREVADCKNWDVEQKIFA